MPRTLTLMGLLIASLPLAAQKSPSPTYAVELTLTRTQSAQAPQVRHFTLRLRPDNTLDSIHVGERLPVIAGKDTYNYTQAGVSLTCRIQPQVGAGVALTVHADLENPEPPASTPLLPRFDSVSFTSDTVVPLDRAVTLATAAGAVAGETYRLEARVTTVP